jgi:hypothetical protein
MGESGAADEQMENEPLKMDLVGKTVNLLWEVNN